MCVTSEMVNNSEWKTVLSKMCKHTMESVQRVRIQNLKTTTSRALCPKLPFYEKRRNIRHDLRSEKLHDDIFILMACSFHFSFL